jgi:glycosyltransferase involved in cell wall biosynthesis
MQVSIVIPCHNAERFIGRCLDSCFAQTHRPIELIAVDDGSADGTAALLEQAAARAPFAMRVVKQENAGACAARNAGLALATGAYIQFMDADDALHPTKIAAQVRIATDQGLPGIVAGSVRTIPPNGDEAQARIERVGHGDAWLDLMSHGLGQTSSNLWKRDDVEACHGWDPAMGSSQEYDLMFRMMQHGARVAYAPEPLTVIYRQPGDSISTKRLDMTYTRFIALRARILAHLRSTQPDLDKHPFEQVLFDAIRTLYPYAPARAVELYHAHFPNGFRPTRSSATGRGYLFLHLILGFDLANRARRALSGRR